MYIGGGWGFRTALGKLSGPQMPRLVTTTLLVTGIWLQPEKASDARGLGPKLGATRKQNSKHKGGYIIHPNLFLPE